MEANQEIITPYLIAYHDQQDRARRFTVPGFMTRELASYYRARQKEQAKRYTEAAVLERLIEATRGQVVKLIVEAQAAKPRKQAGLLKQAEKLNESIEKMRQQVTELLNG